MSLPSSNSALQRLALLHFAEPDYEAFPLIQVCRRAILRGGVYPAVANAANEEANRLFREGKLRFLEIGELVARLRSVRPTDQITHWMISVRRVRPRGSLYANRQNLNCSI